MTNETKEARVNQAMEMLKGATIHQLNMFVESGAKVVYKEVAAASEKTAEPHFPLNKSEEEGRQWYDFLIGKGFIASDTEQACWLYMMGFSSTLPSELKPIAWLKTVETAQLMIRRVHGNLLDTKQLTVAKMTSLASQCFTKQGEPLRLSKPKKEYSQDADEIEHFLPTISDL